MKIKVLLVVLSILFANGSTQNFTINPQCRYHNPSGNEIPNTFVFVIDQQIPWFYREKLMYLFKQISCGIASTADLPIITSVIADDGEITLTKVTSSQLSEFLYPDPDQVEKNFEYCKRFLAQLDLVVQLNRDFMRKNVQFIVPIIGPSEERNCSMFDVFEQRIDSIPWKSELHFNGVLVNSDWSDEKKRQNNITIDIPKIELIDTNMTSMTTAENVEYVMKTAAIVQQIDDFLHREIGVDPNVTRNEETTTTTTTEKPTEIVETFPVDVTTTEQTTLEESTTEEVNMEDFANPVVKTSTDNTDNHSTEYPSDHEDVVKSALFYHVEDRDDVIRDYFWHFLALIFLIALLLFCLMVIFCCCCCYRQKKKKDKKTKTKSRSGSESRSQERSASRSKEPLLLNKKKAPVIIPVKQLVMKHDEVDEWNQIKPGSRENEGAGMNGDDASVRLDFDEPKISERPTMMDEEQGPSRVKRGYHKNQTPTGFTVE